jgi:hypothetical protein
LTTGNVFTGSASGDVGKGPVRTDLALIAGEPDLAVALPDFRIAVGFHRPDLGAFALCPKIGKYIKTNHHTKVKCIPLNFGSINYVSAVHIFVFL